MFNDSRIARYIVPIHLHLVFKNYLANIGAPNRHDPYLWVAVFTVSGTSDRHQKFQQFLEALRRERRVLLIRNSRVEKVREEVALWGLSLETEKKGMIFTRATVTGETQILDRLEKFLATASIL